MRDPHWMNYRTAVIENLEPRTLLSAAALPHVIGITADNRGEVTIAIDTPLRSSTVSSRSVNIFVGKKRVSDQVFYTGNQISVRGTGIKPNQVYSILLRSAIIRSSKGQKLDGEFNGPNQRSGDGKPGGDYAASFKPSKTAVAHIITSAGIMNVALFSKQTPLTVKNFIGYVNRGDYDNSFFHRSLANFVIQGGGFRVGNNGLEAIPTQPPVVNEPHPNSPGNVVGTIAMAKAPGDPNSATSQFFFNLADNRSNLDNQNGGFTVFGSIADQNSLAVMKQIGNLGTFDASSKIGGAYAGNFTNLPITDLAALQQRFAANPQANLQVSDLVNIYRVAILMSIGK